MTDRCPVHDQPATGTVCGTPTCRQCAADYEASLTEWAPPPPKGRLTSTFDGHKHVWRVEPE